MMKQLFSIFILMGVSFFTAIQSGYAQKGIETNIEPLKLDIVLVLDNSGSMKQNDPQLLTRDVVTNFVNGFGENARLGMVIFDQKAVLSQPLGGVATPEKKINFLKSLDDVNYKGLFTNSPDAIERAVYELKTNSRKDAQKVIIFLTDGIVDTGDKARDIEKEKWLKEDLARESRKAGIKIIGIAFTDKADFLLIQTLAIKTEGEYFRAYEAKDIQGTFENIYNLITKPPAPADIPKPEVETVDQKAPEEIKPVIDISEEKPVTATTPQPSPEVTTPPVPKKNLPIPLFIAGAVVLLSIILLFFVFKGRSKQDTNTSGPEILPSMPKAELIDVNSIISKESIRLKKINTEIGRDAKRVITIPEDTISDFHATIDFKDGYFYLEDQRSTNGTYLGGEKIEPNKPIKLKSGDTIRFDMYEFRFVLPDDGQAGGTVLAVKSPQESGTVLRPPKSEKDLSPDETSSSDKETEDQPPQQENETKLKPGMCPNHPARKAAELCPVCKNAFCKQCMTEKDGKQICIGCAGKDK